MALHQSENETLQQMSSLFEYSKFKQSQNNNNNNSSNSSMLNVPIDYKSKQPEITTKELDTLDDTRI